MAKETLEIFDLQGETAALRHAPDKGLEKIRASPGSINEHGASPIRRAYAFADGSTLTYDPAARNYRFLWRTERPAASRRNVRCSDGHTAEQSGITCCMASSGRACRTAKNRPVWATTPR